MISQWYEPESGSAAHPTAVAQAVRKRGHEVQVLTGYPNYPTGRIYPGFRQRWRSRETRDGVALTRVPLWPSHDTSAVRRALGLSSFALSAAAQTSVLAQSDVCLVYLSPATVALPAALLRRRSSVPYVLYVQDLWPDSVLESGFIGSARVRLAVEHALHVVLRQVYDRASGIAVIAPGMRDVLVARGVPEGKITVVPNWVDEEVFRPSVGDAEMRSLLDPADFWLMYAGGVGELQGLESAVQALGLLRGRPEIKLAIVGDGVAVDGLRTMVKRMDLSDRVRFMSSRPLRGMGAVLNVADAQLVILRDLPLFEATIPSKLQASMASGQPVLVSAPGDAAAMARKSGGGVACAPDDPQALADALLSLVEMGTAERARMGALGREYYLREMSERAGGRAIERMLQNAAQGSGRSQ